MKNWNTKSETSVGDGRAVMQMDDKHSFRVVYEEQLDNIGCVKVHYEGKSFYMATSIYNQLIDPRASKLMQDAEEAYNSVMSSWPRSVERREHAHAAALATALTAILKGSVK